jgi:hypothetical protein
MKYLFVLIPILFSLSYSSQYNILLEWEYEFGADSMVWVDTNNVPFSTHVFLRNTNKIYVIIISPIIPKDTMVLFYLNSFNKPSLSINGFVYTKYDYDINNKTSHVCYSTDSAFTNCNRGEMFIEYQYQSNKVVSKIFYNPSTLDTGIITYFYNDSNDVICIKNYNVKTDSTVVDSFVYIYSNEIAIHRWRDTAINESIYYFKGPKVDKIDHAMDGITFESVLFYYSTARLIAPVKFAKNGLKSKYSLPVLLNGRVLRNANSSSYHGIILDKNRSMINLSP